MGTNSMIEWTHHTFNPWRGCTKVRAGCAHCYAETMAARNPAVLGLWGPRGTRAIAAESYWQLPIRWNRHAHAAGERQRVFCASLADVFEGPETMPQSSVGAVDAARLRLWETIQSTPHLDWLLLTKRPQHIMDMLPGAWNYHTMPPNIWIGTSVEDQSSADERIPHLLRVPARIRFLSCEPLIGPVDLRRLPVEGGAVDALRGARPAYGSIDWIIVGGESGAKARPMQPEWARSLRDQAQSAGLPFLFKQCGEWVEISSMGTRMWKVGGRAAGRLLDGREWNEFPEDTDL